MQLPATIYPIELTEITGFTCNQADESYSDDYEYFANFLHTTRFLFFVFFVFLFKAIGYIGQANMFMQRFILLSNIVPAVAYEINKAKNDGFYAIAPVVAHRSAKNSPLRQLCRAQFSTRASCQLSGCNTLQFLFALIC